jgi:hypothetical protein
MHENENLVDRSKLFPDKKYIIGNHIYLIPIVIETDKADLTEVNWDGRLKRLQEYLDVTVDIQSNCYFYMF